MRDSLLNTPEVNRVSKYFAGLEENDAKNPFKNVIKKRKALLSGCIAMLGAGIYENERRNVSAEIHISDAGNYLSPVLRDGQNPRTIRYINPRDDKKEEPGLPKMKWVVVFEEYAGQSASIYFQDVESGELGAYSDHSHNPAATFELGEITTLLNCEAKMGKVFSPGEEVVEHEGRSTPFRSAPL